MKVTENTTYRMLQTNLGRITSKLENLRYQGATGIKLNLPSDDPASIRPVLTTRTQIRHNERYLETMGVTLDKMESTDGHLDHVENILVRAKEVAINAINSGMSNEDLSTLADEISQLRQELLDSANAKVDGKYIFSGYEENTLPFVPNPAYIPATVPPTPGQYDPADSTTWPYIYQGDNNPTELEITPGEYLQTNLTGNDLFLGVANSNWVDSSTAALNQPEAGRIDIFSVLTRVEEAIRAGNVDDPTGPGGGINAQIDNLETAADQERRLRSQLGNKAARVESAMLHQEDVQIDLKQILSRYQDTDAIENFNDIVKQETAFQAALSITAKVSDISILDYF
jgi:flagellar hook-associated protein 3 FlgL